VAAGATEHIDLTTADAFVAEIWSKRALIARTEALVYADRVNMEFDPEAKLGDTIHVPSVGNLAVTTKDRSANAATQYETITEANTDIPVNTWEYAAFAIETYTKLLVSQNLIERYSPKSAYALAHAMDATLAGLPDNFTQIVGALAVDNTYEQILRAVQYLDDANAPQEGRTLIISPAARANFMAIDQFIHSDYGKINGDVGTKATKDAFIGDWMKVPVFVTTNVEGSNAAGHDNTLFQREALALVHPMKMTHHDFFDVDYLAHKFVDEHVYGVAELRDDHGVWVKGK
jgi:hypothetical protein